MFVQLYETGHLTVTNKNVFKRHFASIEIIDEDKNLTMFPRRIFDIDGNSKPYKFIPSI